ncbi:hypothetical protein BST61_g11462 [Cercospora zeina]
MLPFVPHSWNWHQKTADNRNGVPARIDAHANGCGYPSAIQRLLGSTPASIRELLQGTHVAYIRCTGRPSPLLSL